jgi:hypothetical protein
VVLTGGEQLSEIRVASGRWLRRREVRGLGILGVPVATGFAGLLCAAPQARHRCKALPQLCIPTSRATGVSRYHGRANAWASNTSVANSSSRYGFTIGAGLLLDRMSAVRNPTGSDSTASRDATSRLQRCCRGSRRGVGDAVAQFQPRCEPRHAEGLLQDFRILGQEPPLCYEGREALQLSFAICADRTSLPRLRSPDGLR